MTKSTLNGHGARGRARPRLSWHNLRAQLGVGLQLHELQQRYHQARSAVAPGCLQLQHDRPVPSLGDSAAAHGRVQAETLDVGAPRLFGPLPLQCAGRVSIFWPAPATNGRAFNRVDATAALTGMRHAFGRDGKRARALRLDADLAGCNHRALAIDLLWNPDRGADSHAFCSPLLH